MERILDSIKTIKAIKLTSFFEMAGLNKRDYAKQIAGANQKTLPFMYENVQKPLNWYIKVFSRLAQNVQDEEALEAIFEKVGDRLKPSVVPKDKESLVGIVEKLYELFDYAEAKSAEFKEGIPEVELPDDDLIGEYMNEELSDLFEDESGEVKEFKDESLVTEPPRGAPEKSFEQLASSIMQQPWEAGRKHPINRKA